MWLEISFGLGVFFAEMLILVRAMNKTNRQFLDAVNQYPPNMWPNPVMRWPRRVPEPEREQSTTPPNT